MGQAISSTEAFTFALAGLKAVLEHDIESDLDRDRMPEGLSSEW